MWLLGAFQALRWQIGFLRILRMSSRKNGRKVMPLYVYRCPDCGGEEEVRHSMSDLDSVVHPCNACGVRMERAITTPAVARLVRGGTARTHQWYKGKGSKRVV